MIDFSQLNTRMLKCQDIRTSKRQAYLVASLCDIECPLGSDRNTGFGYSRDASANGRSGWPSKMARESTTPQPVNFERLLVGARVCQLSRWPVTPILRALVVLGIVI
jgi:hypothetical protein